MSLGPIMMDVSGLRLTDTEKTQLLKPSIGGVILFARNYESRAQVQALIAEIRQVRDELLIAVDHEGGRVQRFRTGFTHLPAMAALGKVYDQDPALAKQQALACGVVLAYELLEIGVDFSFAPVLDLDYEHSSVIGDRAFHAHASVVAELAGALVEGMHLAGMKSVGKHFPGHGFVKPDSHLELPIDTRSFEQMAPDMTAFELMINQGLDAVMPAHVIYQQVDSQPAGFSAKWLQDILRTQLGFNGVIFSDDLSMQGAHFIAEIGDRVNTALDSGCDMVLICNHPALVAQVIDEHYLANERLHSMRAIKGVKIDKIAYLDYLSQLQELL